jgi:hypothetical protein
MDMWCDRIHLGTARPIRRWHTLARAVFAPASPRRTGIYRTPLGPACPPTHRGRDARATEQRSNAVECISVFGAPDSASTFDEVGDVGTNAPAHTAACSSGRRLAGAALDRSCESGQARHRVRHPAADAGWDRQVCARRTACCPRCIGGARSSCSDRRDCGETSGGGFAPGPGGVRARYAHDDPRGAHHVDRP